MLFAVLLPIIVFCLAGWVIGEVKNWRAVRVACPIVLLFIVAISAQAIGVFKGDMRATSDLTYATCRYVDASADQLNAGNEGRVLETLRKLKTKISPTWQRERFAAEINAATDELESVR